MALIIPALIALLLIYALIKRVNPYEAFARGAAEALPTLVSVLPYLAAMLICISVFRGSGAMDAFVALSSPVLSRLGVPSELVPLIILRPFSGSASLALLQDSLLQYGADTFIGRAASVSVGSTETIFYTLALYFGAVGVSKTRYSAPVAILSGLAGVFVSLWLVRFL